MYLLQSFWNYTGLFCRIWVFIYLFFFFILNDSIKMVIVKYIYSYSCNSIVSKKIQSSFIVYEHHIMLGLLVAQFLNFWQFFKFSKYMIMIYVITVKCISSYSIHSIVLKLCRVFLWDINITICAWFDGRSVLRFLGFLNKKYWNFDIIYSSLDVDCVFYGFHSIVSKS